MYLATGKGKAKRKAKKACECTQKSAEAAVLLGTMLDQAPPAPQAITEGDDALFSESVPDVDAARGGRGLSKAFRALDRFAKAEGGGPYIGPRGGKWKDPEHTIPWSDVPDYKMKVTGKDQAAADEGAKKIKQGIENAADLCQTKPSVCKDNLGIERADMPQVPEDVQPKFLAHLAAKGHDAKHTSLKPGQLKATQKEINADKVMGMAAAVKSGKLNLRDRAIIVSSDNYVLDGHHRWAALLVSDPGEPMPVIQVDMPIKQLLKESLAFPGIKSGQGFGAASQKSWARRIDGYFQKGGPGSMAGDHKYTRREGTTGDYRYYYGAGETPMTPPRGWQNHGGEVWGKPFRAEYTMEDGRKMAFDSMFRIDGRNGQFRVDKADPIARVWEAIDGGEGFPNLRAAAKYADRWLKEVKKQGTFTPHVEKAMGAIEDLEDYIAKADYPTGGPASTLDYQAARDGELRDGGNPKGSVRSKPGPGLRSDGNVASPAPQDEYPCEDVPSQGSDALTTAAHQESGWGMKSLRPGIPMTPDRIREMSAHANAAVVAKLRKGPEPMRYGAPTPLLRTTHTGQDGRVAAMSPFYANNSPGLTRVRRPVERTVLCKGGCGHRHSEILTACDNCGYGLTGGLHKASPQAVEVIQGYAIVDDDQGRPGLRPARVPGNIRITG